MSAGYGSAPVLRGVSLSVAQSQVTALLGRNGAGRSTLCKALMGLIPSRGQVTLNGRSVAGLDPYKVARAGLGYVPEARDVFPGLTTRQNLLLGRLPGQRDHAGPWSIERLFALFPNLADRADVDAARLSGGEQQMLAIARTLMGAPQALIVDEPAEGLAPKMAETVQTVLSEIAAAGTAILLVEQRLTLALDIADHIAVMGQGRIVFEGTPNELAGHPGIRRDWLEV